jgi:exosortase
MKKMKFIQSYPNRKWLFLAFNVAFVLAFIGPLWDLVLTSYRSDTFSYIPFIPFISAYLIYLARETIFSHKTIYFVAGLIPISIGIAILFFTRKLTASFDHNDYLSVIALSMVLIWIGGFALCFGTRSLRAAVFPLLFLYFMVPIPTVALDKIIFFLQSGSTIAAHGFFKIFGIPTVREGFVFHFSTLDIVVAPECSGIRSALSLLITVLLAGHIFLRKGWSKAVLLLLIVPITIIKNGFRIAVLSILGVYVDRRILESELHRDGGILFFILALVLYGVVIMLLRKAEGRSRNGSEPQILVEKADKP